MSKTKPTIVMHGKINKIEIPTAEPTESSDAPPGDASVSEESASDVDEETLVQDDDFSENPDCSLAVPEPDLSLDDDDDTSLVVSLALHLHSEHDYPDALYLDGLKAEALHRSQHADNLVNHSVADHRFRPGRALCLPPLNVHREPEDSFDDEAEPDPLAP